MKNKKLIIGLIIVVICICLFFLFNNSNNKKKDITNVKDPKIEDLLDVYIDGFFDTEPERLTSVFPSFIQKILLINYDKKFLEETLNDLKDEYGNSIKVTYNIEETNKMEDSALESLNKYLKETYENAIEASECYTYFGTFTFKGSKKTDDKGLGDFYYCKFDDTWRLAIY